MRDRIGDSYNQFLNCYNHKSRQVIAAFGKPGVGKSTFINKIISGQKDYPLPTGEGRESITKFPIRCIFSKEKSIQIYKNSREKLLRKIEINESTNLFKQLNEYLKKVNIEFEKTLTRISMSFL